MSETRSIIFFDGYCNLCNGAVQFILPRDIQSYFYLAPLSGSTASDLLKKYPLPEQPDSILLWENNQWFAKSSAALRIAKHLKGWRWVYAFRVIPTPLRDFFYDLIARSRFSIWGRSESCYLPRPEWTSRFLS